MKKKSHKTQRNELKLNSYIDRDGQDLKVRKFEFSFFASYFIIIEWKQKVRKFYFLFATFSDFEFDSSV